MLQKTTYGWNEYFEKEWDIIKSKGLFPGRITADFGQSLKVICDQGEYMSQKHIKSEHDLSQVAVGDWVALEEAKGLDYLLIKKVLKRKTKFSRAASGTKVKEQIVAANIDYVFLIQSMNRDFNLRRLERYLICGWESGAVPVVVLTKADGCEAPEEFVKKVEAAAPGVEIYAVSSIEGSGLESLYKYIIQGKTVALLGSSGVGKSTLLNALAGSQIMKTGEIRENDERGRHVSTHRELFLIDKGGLFLDTPGMRSLSIWEAEDGISEVFGDIEDLAKNCRFYDCTHGNEPGCEIRKALEVGSLSIVRWDSWLKLQKELLFIEGKKDVKVKREIENKWKKIYKEARLRDKNKR